MTFFLTSIRINNEINVKVKAVVINNFIKILFIKNIKVSEKKKETKKYT